MNEDLNMLIDNYNKVVSNDASVTQTVKEYTQKKNELMQQNLDKIAEYLDGLVAKFGDMKFGFYFPITEKRRGYFGCGEDGEQWKISPDASGFIFRKSFSPNSSTAVILVTTWSEVRPALEAKLLEYMKQLIQNKVDEQQERIRNAELAYQKMTEFKL